MLHSPKSPEKQAVPILPSHWLFSRTSLALNVFQEDTHSVQFDLRVTGSVNILHSRRLPPGGREWDCLHFLAQEINLSAGSCGSPFSGECLYFVQFIRPL